MISPRIAVIGIPGKWSSEVLADALAKRTGYRQLIDMATVSADLAQGRLFAGELDLTGLDALVIKKISQQYSPAMLDRLELLRLAEAQGVRVFSPAENIIRMVDRIACTMTLTNGGIPMPATVITEDPQVAMQAIADFTTAVFKPLFSTKAKGMTLLRADQEQQWLLNQIKTFQQDNPVMYIQQKLDLNGRDYGLVFMGGEYLGSYTRIGGQGAWSSVVDQTTGKYALHQPSAEVIAMATEAQALFAMDFTTVDVADAATGSIVFEVSAFGGFRGAHEGIGMDAAGLYADYILAQLDRSSC